MNPLRLLSTSNDILWNNRSSQSARSCRPISIEFVKESKEVILNKKKMDRRADKKSRNTVGPVERGLFCNCTFFSFFDTHRW